MPKKKIVIIGTGFSSLISTLISISKGYKPTILESASSSRILDKHYKKKFFYDANFFGGLSNFWGGAISKVDKSDEKKIFGVNNSSKYYSFVDKLFDQYGKVDEYSKYLRLNNKVKKSNQLNFKYNKTKEILFGSSRIAMSKKEIFNTRNIFQNLLNTKKINVVFGFKVKKFEEHKDKILVYSLNNNIIVCNKLFIGSGSFNTANILMNSDKNLKKIYLRENTINFALVFFKKSINFIDNNSFCDFYMTKLNKRKYHNQIYLLKNKFLIKLKEHNFFYYSFLKILQKIFKNKLIIIFNYMDMNISKKMIIEKNKKVLIFDKLSKKKKIEYYLGIKKDIKDIFKKYNPYYIFLKSGKFSESNHYGSSFPLRKSRKILNSTDKLGRYKKFKNIHIIDSSSIPILPTNTLTYTLMAHSAKITSDALGLNKKK